MVFNEERLTKKALLLLRLPEKYSFTFSKPVFSGFASLKIALFIQPPYYNGY